VDGEDVGVIKGGNCARFLFEATQAIGITRELRRQHLDCDVTS